MKKILYIFLGILIMGAFDVHAAPVANILRSVLPEADNQFYVGTSTPSTLRWKGLYLALDCSSLTNGGALTVDSSGLVQCSADDGGAGGSAAASGSSGSVQFTDGTNLDSSVSFFWDDVNGRLGIGTTSPQARLSVAATSTASGPVFLLSTSTIGVSTSTALVIDSFGRMGVGTSTPSQPLVVQGNSYFQGNIGVGTNNPSSKIYATEMLAGIPISIFANHEDQTNTSSHSRFWAQVGGSGGGNPSFNMTVSGATDWSMGIDNSDGDKFKIGTSFLVGTNSILTVDKNLQVGVSSTSPFAQLSVATTSTNGLGHLALFASSTNKVSVAIDGNGRLGIGTANPQRPLSVEGITYLNGNVGVSSSSPFSQAGVARILSIEGTSAGIALNDINETDMPWEIYNSVGDLYFFDGTAGVGNRVAFLNGGNVGIGTTTPWGQLSVTNISANPSFVVEDSTSPDSTPFIIDASGNVGIGTQTPAQLLHIRGSNSGTILTSALLTNAQSSVGTGAQVGFNLSTNVNITNARFGAVVETTGTGFFIQTNDGSLTSERLRVTGAGNVGVGGTSTPAARLAIQNGNVVGLYLAGFSNQTADLIRISTSTASATSTALILNNKGHMAIGTTTFANEFTLNVENSVQVGTITATSSLATSTLAGPLRLGSTGSSPTVGNATMVAGTVTVTTGAATPSSFVYITRKTSGGTIGTAITYTVTTGSFTITSDSVLDTSTFTWFLVN